MEVSAILATGRTGLTAGRTRQRGSVLAIVAISLALLFGIGGLAIDLGHAYVNKTRLQNAVDAAALSAAITLNRSGELASAIGDGNATFADFSSQPGNSELQSFDPANLQYEFSVKLIPFANVAGSANPKFVRVIASDYQLPAWLIRVLGITEKRISATAVSGPIPLQTVCNIAPMMVCAEVDSNGQPIDTTCGDGACFGYTTEELVVLKDGPDNGGGDLGPGNFRLIRLPGNNGANDVRDALAGGYETCAGLGDTITTQTGVEAGPVRDGINIRFGDKSGSLDSDLYKPDLVTAANTIGSDKPGNYTPVYPAYQNAYRNGIFDQIDGEPERRIITVPFADCRGGATGTDTLPLVGFGCFFLTRKVEVKGQNTKEVFSELVDNCGAKGRPDPNSVSGPGPFKIVLFKNPDGTDA